MAFYYNDPNFRNIVYALKAELEIYMSKFFKGDTSRLIYSSNAYALRARFEQLTETTTEQDSNNKFNFNLPFMNFKLMDATPDTSRNWQNTKMSTTGLWFPEIQRNLSIIPVKLIFDSTIFFDTFLDNTYFLTEILYEQLPESLISFDVDILGETAKMQGVISYNYSFQSRYNENEWLEKNKIHTQSLDFEVDTFLLRDNENPKLITVPKKYILNFKVKNCLGEVTDEEVYIKMEEEFEKQ